MSHSSGSAYMSITNLGCSIIRTIQIKFKKYIFLICLIATGRSNCIRPDLFAGIMIWCGWLDLAINGQIMQPTMFYFKSLTVWKRLNPAMIARWKGFFLKKENTVADPTTGSWIQPNTTWSGCPQRQSDWPPVWDFFFLKI